MVSNPYENGGFASPEDDDEEDKKPKKAEPAKVGSVLLRGKKADSEREKPKWNLFEQRERPEKDGDSKDTSDDAAKSSDKGTETVVQITEEAKREAALEQIEEDLNLHQVQLEQAVPGTAEHIQAAAATDYLERVKEAVSSPETTVDPVIQAEADRRITIAGEELTSLSAEGLSLKEETETILEVPSIEGTIAPPAPGTEAVHNSPDDESESAVPVGTTGPTVTTAGSSRAASPPTTTSTAGAPPPPPSSPTARGGHGGGNFNGGNNSSANLSPVAPERTGHRDLELEREKAYQKSKRRQALLAGGLVGYAIGRRGGRKRSEAKLKPQISRLETEVRASKKNLVDRELEVQRAALQRRNEQAPQPIANPEKTPSPPTPEKFSERLPATEILRRAVIAPVEIEGSRNQTSQERQPQPIPEVTATKQAEQIEKLSTPDILKLAESLYISGVSIRRLYETNQIDRRGLVHIVKEGMHGGDLKSAFKTVELGQERQRERAREFRHDDPGFSTSTPVQNQQTPSATYPTSAAPLPNQPNQESIQPISQTVPNLQRDQAVQLEELRKMASRPNLLTPVIIIAIGLALMIIWFVF